MAEEVEKGTPLQTKLAAVLTSPHFWAILVLIVGIVVSYYADLLDLSWLPLPQDLNSAGRLHDLYRSLFLIPMLYAGLVFRLRGALAVTFLFLVVILPRGLLLDPRLDALLTTVTFAVLASSATVLLGLSQDRRLAERKTLNELKTAHEQLRSYTMQIARAQEEERKRIAHELHDETAQSLAIIALDLESLTAKVNGLVPAETVRRLEKTRDAVNRTLEETRRFSQDLRPSALEHLGLLPALESLVSDIGEYSGIRVSLGVVGSERRLPEEVELMLFRIVQEALRNVARHSGATSADVTVEFGQSKTIVTVRDNGKGFTPPMTPGDLSKDGKLGLAGMQERVHVIGGTLAVHSIPGHGSTITAKVPA